MATYALTNLYPALRLRIGDIDPTAYRYIDAWLLESLKASVEELGKWWNFKYLLTDLGEVYRNPNSGDFIFPESYGVVEMSDKQIIVTMAAFILLEGSLENMAYNFVSWRDAEIAYSNLESSRSRSETLRRLWETLMITLLPPTKRLAYPLKMSLPGYKDNPYEVGYTQTNNDEVVIVP